MSTQKPPIDQVAAELHYRVWTTYAQLGVLRRQINQIRHQALHLARLLYESMPVEARDIDAKLLAEWNAKTPDPCTDDERVERARQWDSCQFRVDLVSVDRWFMEQLERCFGCDTLPKFYKRLDEFNSQVKKGQIKPKTPLYSYSMAVEAFGKSKDGEGKHTLSRESVQDYYDWGFASDETETKLRALMDDGKGDRPELRQLHPRYHEQAKWLKRAAKEADEIKREQRRTARLQRQQQTPPPTQATPISTSEVIKTPSPEQFQILNGVALTSPARSREAPCWAGSQKVLDPK